MATTPISELSPALEHYLKEVSRLQRHRNVARVRDLARGMRVAKSAVTAALRSLGEKGLVDYRPYDPAILTPAGRARVEKLELRYRVLVTFLGDVLDLDPHEADETACAMEHAIGSVALERLICFLAFVGKGGRRRGGWLQRFRAFLRGGDEGQICRKVVDEFLQDIQDGIDGSRPTA